MSVADQDFLNDEGKIDWDRHAQNDGIEPGTLVENQTLKPGTLIDRYGSEKGNYTAPMGTDYESRALPYKNNPFMYYKYEVINEIDGVDVSKVASAFGCSGGAVQYQLPISVRDLVDTGYLRRIPVVENIISPSSVISTEGAYLASEKYLNAKE